MSIHDPCPHCLELRVYGRGVGYSVVYIRCPGCRCRWDLRGNLIKWGSACPRLAGKKRRPTHAKSLGSAIIQRGRPGAASGPDQRRLL